MRFRSIIESIDEVTYDVVVEGGEVCGAKRSQRILAFSGFGLVSPLVVC